MVARRRRGQRQRWATAAASGDGNGDGNGGGDGEGGDEGGDEGDEGDEGCECREEGRWRAGRAEGGPRCLPHAGRGLSHAPWGSGCGAAAKAAAPSFRCPVGCYLSEHSQ